MRALAIMILVLLAPALASAQFAYEPAGSLVSGSGTGRVDARVWVGAMRFPIRDAPAYANSQVWGVGGSSGPRGGQCDARNYSYPWHDNYCETRGWSMPLCPTGRGHQGQDIRPGTCRAGVNPAVAAVDGRITHIGTYTVYLTADDGTRFDYLHMSNVAVTMNQRVHCGDVLGMVSNQFGRTSTTIHLHFNIRQAVRGVGSVFVPPYTSLVGAYERLLAGDVASCGPGMDAGMRDAGGSDAGMRDAFVARDAFTPRDAFVARDAFTPPRDAFMARDAFTPSDAFVARDAFTPPRDAGRRDAGGGCRSTLLGRTVTEGECVQLAPDQRDCDSAGCGWYRCESSAWACAPASACTGAMHPNSACSSSGQSCWSNLISQEVPHGACVQQNIPACGLPTCGWYRCVDGGWVCSDSASCTNDRVTHPDCTDCNLGGETCTTGAVTCCPAFYCEPRAWGSDARNCCSGANTPCTQNSDCCGTMECLHSVCQCHPTGGSCAGDLDCCSGLWCTDGVCGAV